MTSTHRRAAPTGTTFATSAALRAAPLVALLFAAPAAGQHPESTRSVPVEGVDFAVYHGEGRIASFADLLGELDEHDVVLVGEQHDDMVGHGFQTSLLAAAFEQQRSDRTVVLSLEMFERDVQYVVDEYLAGLISEEHFLKSARPWPEYETRYRPAVEFARAHGLPIVAANAPRRYVNRVSREGPESLEALSAAAKRYLPPLPYPGPSETYRAQWDAVMAEAMASMRAQADSAHADASDAEVMDAEPPAAEDTDTEQDDAPPPQHYAPSPHVIYSQALWDAAMGEAITGALKAAPGALVIHLAGSFHVEKGTGIPERIADYRPATRVLSVVMVPVQDVRVFDEAEHEDLGDFVVLTQAPPEAQATESR